MSIQSSGPVSLQDVQDEFGGEHPIGINEYYGKSSLPQSGPIGLADFYGATALRTVWSVQTTPNVNPVDGSQVIQSYLHYWASDDALDYAIAQSGSTKVLLFVSATTTADPIESNTLGFMDDPTNRLQVGGVHYDPVKSDQVVYGSYTWLHKTYVADVNITQANRESITIGYQTGGGVGFDASCKVTCLLLTDVSSVTVEHFVPSGSGFAPTSYQFTSPSNLKTIVFGGMGFSRTTFTNISGFDNNNTISGTRDPLSAWEQPTYHAAVDHVADEAKTYYLNNARVYSIVTVTRTTAPQRDLICR